MGLDDQFAPQKLLNGPSRLFSNSGRALALPATVAAVCAWATSRVGAFIFARSGDVPAEPAPLTAQNSTLKPQPISPS